MRILHVSAECYPAAKAGGLGDVAGALPKYLNQLGTTASVVIPKYHTKWILSQEVKSVFQGEIRLGSAFHSFTVELVNSKELGFELYLVNIPGKYDRPGVYADESGQPYRDEVLRALSFQQSVLEWVLDMDVKPSVVHCHDHHTALIPFMMQYSVKYGVLSNIPQVFTIHNGEYQGSFDWHYAQFLPLFDSRARGLLDWDYRINPIACAIKCCWKLTTVSPSYMRELQWRAKGLEWLLRNEEGKSVGILNGIDTKVWDPTSDKRIDFHMDEDIGVYKSQNKKQICTSFKLKEDLPLVVFIGRLVGEKGADLLPGAISHFYQHGHQANFIILGTGEKSLHAVFESMQRRFNNFRVVLAYNEDLAHKLYASGDFLIMPSRVEPCGLNQMYAFRYGTIPIVRSVGGLRDTVHDFETSPQGTGIRFDDFSVNDASWAVFRATRLYANKQRFITLRQNIMNLDLSWTKSAQTYYDLYSELMAKQ